MSMSKECGCTACVAGLKRENERLQREVTRLTQLACRSCMEAEDAVVEAKEKVKDLEKRLGLALHQRGVFEELADYYKSQVACKCHPSK